MRLSFYRFFLSTWVSFLMKFLFCFLFIFRLSLFYLPYWFWGVFMYDVILSNVFSRKWSVSFQFYFPILSKAFNSILLLFLKILPHCRFLPFILISYVDVLSISLDFSKNKVLSLFTITLNFVFCINFFPLLILNHLYSFLYFLFLLLKFYLN